MTACTGSSDCPATTHIHGCFADRGSCDQPREHSDIDTLAATVEDALDAYWEPPSEAHSALDALVEHVRTMERERNEALERELRNRLLLNHADARADRIEKTLDDACRRAYEAMTQRAQADYGGTWQAYRDYLLAKAEAALAGEDASWVRGN